MKDKIKLKDLSWPLKIGIIMGLIDFSIYLLNKDVIKELINDNWYYGTKLNNIFILKKNNNL